MVSDYSSILKMNYEEEEVVPNAWSSELLVDLLSLIADKVRSLSLTDFIKFGSVCFEWRSFCIENYEQIKLPSNLPLLLIPLSSSSPSKTDNQNYTPSPSSSSSSSTLDEKEEVDNQNYILSPPSSSSSSSSSSSIHDKKVEEKEEVWVEEVEEDYGKEEELGVEVKELEEEDEEEDEEDEGIVEMVWNEEDFYDPRDIWEGQDCKQRYRSTRNLYSIYQKRVDFPLPVPYYKNIRGSSHGWLVAVEECCSEDGVAYYPVRLFNPFRTDNNEIQLPTLTPFMPEDKPLNTSYYLKKAFLSANPSSLSDPITQLVVLGVNFSNKLGFCRPGDKAWTYVETERAYRPILDIICYQDQFYAILQNGFVFAFILFKPDDQLHPSPAITVHLLPPEEDNYPPKGFIMRYLVESRGELLQIRRDVASCSGYYKTSQFVVFKLDPKDPANWVHTKTLNDSTFFLGSSSTSMSLSALDYPGCKPNSIYYTDDMDLNWDSSSLNGPYDIGIFNVEDGSFELHDELELKIMPTPIWIQPMI